MRYLFKPFLISLLLVFATTGFYAPSASAHGEKSQAAFMRMRTIHWFDLNWSKEVVPVNDTMTISGKFYVFSGWPETVDKPDVSFLNIGIPGPVFIRAGSWIGGQLVPRSVSLELGETYEFKVLLKARRPGDWHVHTMMNVKGGGPIIGPGKWVIITGSMSSFTNPITTLTGENIDLETYNLGNTYFWHAFWYGLGLLWVAYWVRKPMFVPRLIAVDAGKADSLITLIDKKVALAFGTGTIAIVAMTMAITNEKFPITTPLQSGLLRGIKSIDMPVPTVGVKIEDATYRVPGRAMQMTMTVTNNGDSAIRLGEFNTAGIRFLDADVYVDDTNYPSDMLAENGLSVSDNSPLAPGQSRTMQVTASDAAWEVYRLADLIYDPDSRFAGLLFFYDAIGNRSMVSVDAPLIPTFIDGGGPSGPGGGGSGPPPQSFGGSQQPPEDKNIPQFPWPPPRASTSEVIPSEFLVSKTGATTLQDVERRIREALEKNGYFEKSYYAVPRGFALVTRIEQINDDGTSKEGSQRWSLDVPRLHEWSFKAYVRAVFLAPPGYFRVIAFIVTPHQIVQSESKVTPEEAEGWLKGGNQLPGSIGRLDFSLGYACTALVYEFKRRTEADEPKVLFPGEILGRIHLVKAGLWEALTR